MFNRFDDMCREDRGCECEGRDRGCEDRGRECENRGCGCEDGIFDCEDRGCRCRERCRCERNNSELRRRIREAICDIKEGLKLICAGIREISRGRLCDGKRCICEGLELIECALNNLIEAIRCVDFPNCRSRRQAEDGICDIKEGICDIRKGLEDIPCDVCCALKCINQGFRRIEEGLCDVMNALRCACF